MTITIEKRPGWDDYFLAIAMLAATRSHDNDTKHGCVIVDAKHRQVGMGYNGYPRGCGEEQFPDTRPAKYDYIIHAELNAILNCERRPDGATVYVTGCPCPHCMLAMIQAGIVRVVYGTVQSASVDCDKMRASMLLACACGVALEARG